MSKSITITAKELLHLIGRVKPFTSKEKHFPPLNSIHLYTEKGFLWAEATDRVTMAGARGPKVEAPFDALIDPDCIKRITYLARWWKGETFRLSASPEDRTLKVQAGSGKPFRSLMTVTFSPPFGKFPEIRRSFMPQVGSVMPDPVVANFATELLAKLAALAPGGYLHTQGVEAATFVADDAWALIMPRRGDADWSDAVSALHGEVKA